MNLLTLSAALTLSGRVTLTLTLTLEGDVQKAVDAVPGTGVVQVVEGAAQVLVLAARVRAPVQGTLHLQQEAVHMRASQLRMNFLSLSLWSPADPLSVPT